MTGMLLSLAAPVWTQMHRANSRGFSPDSTERMACYWSGSSPGAAEAHEYASSSMLDAAAGAVAARGVLFANVHQASLRRLRRNTCRLTSSSEGVLTQRNAVKIVKAPVAVHDDASLQGCCSDCSNLFHRHHRVSTPCARRRCSLHTVRARKTGLPCRRCWPGLTREGLPSGAHRRRSDMCAAGKLSFQD